MTGYDPARTAAVEGLRQAARLDDLGRDFDVCIEAVGHRSFMVEEALRVCRDRGRILLFGIPPKGTYGIDLHDFMQRRLALAAGVHPEWSRWLPAAEAYLMSPRGRDLDLTTHRCTVDRAQLAYETAVDDPAALKVLVDFRTWPTPTGR